MIQPGSWLAQDILTVANKVGIDPYLLAGMVVQESGGDQTVVAHDNGYGLTQLTSKGLVQSAGAGLFNAVVNLTIGAQYLKQNIQQQGSVWSGLEAYNGGGTGYANSVLANASMAQAANIFQGLKPGPLLQNPLGVQPPHYTNGQFAPVPAGTWPLPSGSTQQNIIQSLLGNLSGGVENILGTGVTIGKTLLPFQSPLTAAPTAVFDAVQWMTSHNVPNLGNIPVVGGIAGPIENALISAVGGMLSAIGKWLILGALAVAIFVLFMHLVTNGQSTQVIKESAIAG